MRKQDLARSLGWWFLPGNCKRPIIGGVRCFVRVIRFEPNDQLVLVHEHPSYKLCDGAVTVLAHSVGCRVVLIGCDMLLQGATVVTRPETTSSSHRRPCAMALTRRARCSIFF